MERLINMSPDEFKESMYELPQGFDFDEDFDSECFEENLNINDPSSI